ncbi:MAG TPA: ornithine cyclodeaminase family protein [Trueperaceae bacterium]|jgi:ornithine cyclodeaminase
MAAPEVLVLSGREVAQALSLERCIGAVAEAFVAHHRGEGRAYPVVRQVLPKGGIFGVKSGFLPGASALGLKAGGFWADNAGAGVPTHQSAALLFDPATGQLRAVLDANVITVVRTAAAGALAARALAPAGTRLAAVIGAGTQAIAQTHALKWARPDLVTVRVFARSDASYRRFRAGVAALDATFERAALVRSAVDGADAIVTATPSWEPLVRREWVAPGAYVAAFGADTVGKQELDPEVLRDAQVVVDDWEQARTIGECQHAHRLGFLPREAVHGELGAILAGELPGRQDDARVTVFDSTGIALQDLAAAVAAIEAAHELGLGSRVRLADAGDADVWAALAVRSPA